MSEPQELARFRAPWGRELMVMSTIFVLTVAVPAAIQLARGGLVVGLILTVVAAIPLTLMVRRYELVPGELRIRRLCWATRWPLAGLTEAVARPDAMKTSWRTWGIEGVFSFSGHFSNAALGRYRAFVTDHKKAVVLRLPGSVLVVSPDRPDDFVRAVTEAARATRAV